MILLGPRREIRSRDKLEPVEKFSLCFFTFKRRSRTTILRVELALVALAQPPYRCASSFGRLQDTLLVHSWYVTFIPTGMKCFLAHHTFFFAI